MGFQIVPTSIVVFIYDFCVHNSSVPEVQGDDIDLKRMREYIVEETDTSKFTSTTGSIPRQGYFTRPTHAALCHE